MSSFHVINYMPTVRRSGKKIDYFVVAPPDVVEPESVKALNFNNTVQGNDLHPLMSGHCDQVLVYLTPQITIEKLLITILWCMRSYDHK